MSDTMISVNKFTKMYGKFKAVDAISFNVHRGEIFGLLGPNGAGKTSTLESLEGLRSPDSGHLLVGDVDPSRDARKLRNLIGVQLQSSGMPEAITVAESMNFFCAYHGVAPRYDILERLGLKDKMNTQFQQLSTGLQRRLSLAIAIAHNPAVIFLDEPTAGLDVATRVELHNIMRELKKEGSTIILATHDMAEAEEMSDRVAILLKGKIVATGTPLEITATGAGMTKISVQTADSHLKNPEFNIPGTTRRMLLDEYAIFYSSNIGASVGAIINSIQANHDTLIDLRVERPSLEDRFLEITQKGE